MPYFVIGPDGSKFGPADILTLKEWVAENRVGPQTVLEDSDTSQRYGAFQIPGLFEVPATQPYAATPGPQNYPPPGSMYANPPSPAQYPRMAPGSPDSNNDLVWSFVLFGIGATMCFLSPILCAFGIVQANKAIAKGNPTGSVARILNLILLIIGLCVWAVYFVFIVLMVSGVFK